MEKKMPISEFCEKTGFDRRKVYRLIQADKRLKAEQPIKGTGTYINWAYWTKKMTA